MWKRMAALLHSMFAPKQRSAGGSACCRRKLGHGFGLGAFRSLHDLELHAVALIQRAEPAALDGRVMDKYVGAIILGNKPIPLLIVEPFDGTSCHVGHPPDMGERYAAFAARRRLKTALASVYPYAVPFNLTEIMRTAVDLKSSASVPASAPVIKS